jgi:hypothetical protein
MRKAMRLKFLGRGRDNPVMTSLCDKISVGDERDRNLQKGIQGALSEAKT